jgi:phage terminase large subunit-like protein
VNRGEARALLEFLVLLAPEDRRVVLSRLPAAAFRTVAEEWWWKAHGGQEEPRGDWPVWLLMAGRGFGKTRAGAEWVWARVREVPSAQIALVGGTLDEVAKVMVKGPSGLIATAGTGEEDVRWVKDRRTLHFGCGAQAFAYSAEAPEALRGPEHDFAWCDELAKWRHGRETWDNLMLGLRRGSRPRALVTTTPRPVPLLRQVRALAGIAETRGASIENPHLAKAFLATMDAAYGGTRLGRQELGGELIEDVEGTLWPRGLIEESRMGTVTFPHGGVSTAREGRKSDCPLTRVVIGVDPPGSARGTCGISVCGQGEDGMLYVLADASARALSPNGWARAVGRAAEQWGADRVVAEANHGGDMVAEVLKAVAPALPLKLVHASRGKVARAEPVAALFENKEAKFAGRFPALEDELAGMVTGGRYEGPGDSPDRADAMVWAMTELMARGDGPRIRRL